jgi:hypothetical protein
MIASEVVPDAIKSANSMYAGRAALIFFVQHISLDAFAPDV